MKNIIPIIFCFCSINLYTQDKIDSTLKDHPLVPGIDGSKLIFKDVYEDSEYLLIESKIITTPTGDKFVRPNDRKISGKVTRLTYIMGKTMQRQLNPQEGMINPRKGKFALYSTYHNFLHDDGFEMQTRSSIGRIFYRFKHLTNHPHSYLIEPVDTVSVLDAAYGTFYKKNTNSSIYVVYTYSMIRRDTNYYFLDVIEIPNQLSEKKLEEAIINTGKIEIHDILFKIGSAEILEESKKMMDVLANVLSKNPDLKILIIGHTDSIGDISSNLNLSQRRADAIANSLINNYNINSERMATKGLGESQPLNDNNTEEGRKLNRRIEIIKME